MLRIRPLVLSYFYGVRRQGFYRGTRAFVGQFLRSRDNTGKAFDASLSVDTAGNSPMWKLDIASKNAYLGEPYQPTKEDDLIKSISALNIDCSQHVFIDLGCGKAKPLIIASKFGFKTLIGVEFARDLATIAELNMKRCNIPNGSILNTDAIDFKFPADSPFVLFLFNPFKAEIMRKVLRNLCDLPRKDYFIIYNNPRESAVFHEFDKLELASVIETDPPSQIWRSR